MEVPDDTPETDERCRSIERGSKLVSVMPSIFAVVLQAPRGNIETIYPRALVLAGIRTFIDQKKYRSAFLACRSQMVDLNILHDYAPEQFMENVALFVDQVKKVDYIDDFISRLSYVNTPCSNSLLLTPAKRGRCITNAVQRHTQNFSDCFRGSGPARWPSQSAGDQARQER